VRGRVEAPYGHGQTLFRVLREPFGEDEEQLDCVVRTAAAIHRLKLE